MKKIIVLIGISLLLLSCSDFLNSKSTSNGGNSVAPVPAGGYKPFDDSFNPNTGEFSEAKMLANIGLNVIVPAVRRFSLQAQLLDDKVNQYCDGLQVGEAPAMEESVKQQWQETMMTYHFVNAIPIGPGVDHARLIADSIYSWPLVNFCGVDQEVVSLVNSKKVNTRMMFTSKGLAALEYLFYDSSLGTVCNRDSKSNKDIVEWTEKSSFEKKKDRCAFAKVLTKDLATQARALDRAWHPQEGNFSRGLMEGVYGGLKETVNRMSDALFSVEAVKDLRLGKPLGLNKECYSEEGRCPESVEHAWSGLSLQAVEAEVAAFRAVYHGSVNPQDKAFGFDDYLAEKGGHDVAAALTDQSLEVLNRVIEVAGLGTLEKQIRDMSVADCKASTADNRKVPVCSMYQDLRQLTKHLKNDFLILLSLRAPPSTEGDND